MHWSTLVPKENVLKCYNRGSHAPPPSSHNSGTEIDSMPWGKFIDWFRLVGAWLTLKQNSTSKKKKTIMTECRVRAVVRALAFHQCGSGSIPSFAPHVGWDCCWLFAFFNATLFTISTLTLLHYYYTNIYAYNILTNYTTYTYNTYACTTLQYDTKKRLKEMRSYLQHDWINTCISI